MVSRSCETLDHVCRMRCLLDCVTRVVYSEIYMYLAYHTSKSASGACHVHHRIALNALHVTKRMLAGDT